MMLLVYAIMKFDLEQLDPITREFVKTHPDGSAIQVSSRWQRRYYLVLAPVSYTHLRAHETD